jgi:hypothetical protein
VSFPFRFILADLVRVWNNNSSDALRHSWCEAVRLLTASDGEASRSLVVESTENEINL